MANNQYSYGSRYSLARLFVYLVILLIGYLSIGHQYIGQNLIFIQLNRALSGDNVHPEDFPQSFQTNISSSARVRYGLALYLQRTNQQPEALQLWQTIPNGDQLTLKWGQNAEAQGNYQTALAWYEQVTHLRPELADGWYYAGLANQLMGEDQAAELYFKNGLEKSAFKNIQKNSFYVRLAQIEAKKTSPDWYIVLDLTDKALIAQAGMGGFLRSEAYFLRGEAYRNIGQLSEALDEYREAIEQYSEHYQAHMRFARLVWSQEGDYDYAEEILLRAQEIHPNAIAGYIVLGQLYLETSEVDKAIEMFEQVLGLDSENQQAKDFLESLREQ